MASELYTLGLGHAAAPSLPLLSQSPLHGHRRTSLRFYDFGGLKIRTYLPSSSSSRMIMSSRSTSDARSCRIVSDPQQTAVEVACVTESTWEALVVSCDSLVLVEFWAPWCGPCRTLHPVIDNLAKQYAGKLKCYKINTDEFPSIPTRYGIRSIPTIVMFKNGEEIETIVGAVPESTFTACVDKFL